MRRVLSLLVMMALRRDGYLAKMFFNPNRDYFECIPKTDGTAR